MFSIYAIHFIGKAVFQRALPPTISFLPCQIDGPLFDIFWFLVAVRRAATARGWHQVVRRALIAVCCSVFQCGVVCCSVLQCVAVWCSVV